MSITGEPEGMPMKVGVAISDVLTGLYAAVSVLAGLVGRDRGTPATGFDLALADCTLAALVNVAQSALVTGKRPRRYGNAHPQIVPYEAFVTADGHLALAVGADRQWERLCRAVGQDAWLADARFRTNPDRVKHRHALLALLQPLFASRTTADWEQTLSAAEVPHARIAAIDEVLASPQTAARAMVQEVTDTAGRKYRLLGSPINWADRESAPPVAPPDVGGHSDAILRDWLDYEDARITELRMAGAIAS
jgi:crotonobetainyl-CoA:carnitine CoA-transferase CaiB-like acyl-CoA transferase